MCFCHNAVVFACCAVHERSNSCASRVQPYLLLAFVIAGISIDFPHSSTLNELASQ